MDLPNVPQPGQTRVAAVMQHLRGQIAARDLPPGARVPSIRRQAAVLGVSVSTVVEAYDRLAAEGAIAPRAGSGFYVARHAVPFRVARDLSPRERAVDPLWIMRQSLDAAAPGLKPGCGWLPASWMPQEAMQRALRRVARDGGAGLVEYDAPLGFAPLRALLSGPLADRGIDAGPERICLTDSGTQALDLVARFLLEPGDTVLLDDPCYFNFQAALRAHRATIVSVPYTAQGPDLAAFDRIAAERKPRLYVTNASLHNPTGASLSAAAAHRLLKLAERHGTIVVEDDIFADFETAPSPRLAAADGLERVIHLGSFSKTLSAGVRCGFIAAREDWVQGMADLKLATQFGNAALGARLVHRLLVDGGYRRHMEQVRGKLARAMAETARRIEAAGLTLWAEPRGGMFLWAALPVGLDSGQVAQAALADGMVLAPGNVFSPSRTAGRFLRFNAAQSGSPQVFEKLRRAMAQEPAINHLDDRTKNNNKS